MKRRVWGAVFAAVVTAALLGGCQRQVPADSGTAGSDTGTSTTVTAAAISTTDAPPVAEVPGYDAYKAGAVADSGLAAAASNFQADEPSAVYTFRVIPGNFTGAGDDAFVIYMVAQQFGTYEGEPQYDYYFVYALISGDRAVGYWANEEFYQQSWQIYGEAADVDGDGHDEVILGCDWGGTGGCILLRVYHYDGTGFVDYPVGPDNEPCSLQATGKADGYYTVTSAETGYSETFHSDAWDQLGEQQWPAIGIDADLVTNYSVTDVDGDGVAEIGIGNTYWYGAHCNKCGTGIEVYKYDAALGRFKVIWTTYIRIEDMVINNDHSISGDLGATVLGPIIKKLYK